MSAYIYGACTRNREKAQQHKSKDTDPPGFAAAVDSLAALVPAEVLIIHAGLIAIWPPTSSNDLIKWLLIVGVLGGGAVLSSAIYVWGHKGGVWNTGERLDRQDKIPRMFIPAIAFIAWTAAQPGTAFDVLVPPTLDAMRVRVGLAAVVTVIIGVVAAGSSIGQDKTVGPGYNRQEGGG